jgi:hypothetical protein
MQDFLLIKVLLQSSAVRCFRHENYTPFSIQIAFPSDVLQLNAA